MATTRKAAADPLIEELPPVQESKPKSSDDIKFDVEISPIVLNGELVFRWTILDHNMKGWVGDYSGHSQMPGVKFLNAHQAEMDARRYVRGIRQVVDLKLSAPDTVVVTI